MTKIEKGSKWSGLGWHVKVLMSDDDHVAYVVESEGGSKYVRTRVGFLEQFEPRKPEVGEVWATGENTRRAYCVHAIAGDYIIYKHENEGSDTTIFFARTLAEWSANFSFMRAS